MQPSRDIARLIEIVQALREPLSGCAWDREQTFETIVPYTIEEAYEIADAVARGDMADLREELGDLLLQVVFQSRIAEEHACFDFGAVVEAITQKMIRGAIRMFSERRVTSPLRCGRPFGAPSRLRKKPPKKRLSAAPAT